MRPEWGHNREVQFTFRYIIMIRKFFLQFVYSNTLWTCIFYFHAVADSGFVRGGGRQGGTRLFRLLAWVILAIL